VLAAQYALAGAGTAEHLQCSPITWKFRLTDEPGLRTSTRHRRAHLTQARTIAIAGRCSVALIALSLFGGSNVLAQSARSKPSKPTPSRPASAAASAAASAKRAEEFVLKSGNDTIAVETMQQNGSDITAAMDARGSSRYTLDLKVDSQSLVSRLEIKAYGEASTTPTAHAIVAIVGDSVFAQVGTGIQRAATKVGAIPWVNPSFALLQVLVQRAHRLGAGPATIPLFLIEGGSTVSATVTRVGADSTVVEVGGAELRLHTSPSGEVLGGAVPAQRTEIVRRTIPYVATGVALAKPDYSAPANAPYTSEDVRVNTPGSYVLAGTLTMPRNRSARVPAVVMITGSGLEDRDETVPGVNGYRPFRQIADTLSRRGIAVLRMDDRSFGESGGDATSATTADFANDIRAALAYLKSRPDIDDRHLFLIGHSEGGEIAPMIAATDPSLAGIVTLAGPAETGREISHAQLAYAVSRDSALSAARRDSIVNGQDAILDSAAAHQPWVKYYLSYDPIATAKSVRVPALVLQGGNDRQISPDQAEKLAAALRAGGDKDVTVHVFPELDHLFLVDPTGDPSGYSRLPSRAIGADVLGTIADWVSDHSK
jgi:uncharacterized protein